MDDFLHVSFDSNERKNEYGLCVARPSKDGSHTVLKMLLDVKAKNLYRALTDQAAETIVLPDSPTNGDVIKAVFPNIEFTDMAFTIHAVANVTSNGVKGGISYDFWKDWWNAPYKREVEE